MSRNIPTEASPTQSPLSASESPVSGATPPKQKTGKGRTERIFMIISSVLLLTILLLLFFFWLMNIIYFNQVIDSTRQAAYNRTYCDENPGKCDAISGESEPILTNSSQFGSLTTFNKELALFCIAQISAVGNQTPPHSQLTSVRELFTKEKGAPSIGFTAFHPATNTVYIIFRGTRTQSEWEHDLNFSQRQLKSADLAHMAKMEYVFSNPLNHKDHPHTFSFHAGCSSNTMVHRGFYKVFDEIRIQVDAHMNMIFASHTVQRFVIAGHSLGAALASLTGLFLRTHFSVQSAGKIVVYTFGKPRVGNPEYRSCVSSLSIVVHRVQNEDDVITAIPLSANPNLSEHKEPYLFDHEGEPQHYQNNWKSLLWTHSIQNYRDYVSSLP